MSRPYFTYDKRKRRADEAERVLRFLPWKAGVSVLSVLLMYRFLPALFLAEALPDAAAEPSQAVPTLFFYLSDFLSFRSLSVFLVLFLELFFLISVFQYVYFRTDSPGFSLLFGLLLLFVFGFFRMQTDTVGYLLFLPPVYDVYAIFKFLINRKKQKAEEEERKIAHERGFDYYRGNFNYNYDKASYRGFSHGKETRKEGAFDGGEKTGGTGAGGRSAGGDSRKAAPEGDGFFAGCRTEADYRKRYTALCKKYHPDSPEGDREIFEAVQKQYEAYRRKR